MELKERLQGLIQLLQQAIEKQIHIFLSDKNHFDLAFGDLSYNFSPEPALRSFGSTSGLAIPERIPILEDTHKEIECNEFQLYGQVKWQEKKLSCMRNGSMLIRNCENGKRSTLSTMITWLISYTKVELCVTVYIVRPL